MSFSDTLIQNDLETGPIITHKTYCRVCQAHCPMEVDVKNGKPIAVRGDRNDPVYRGYTCIKGRQVVAQYDQADRITAPLKKKPDGTFEEITIEQAYDEIAEIVSRNIKDNGPRSIASYIGTFGHMSQPAGSVAMGFHKGIGSESYYTTATIDQCEKFLAASRFGTWGGGIRGFSESDVLMLIGINPLVAHSGSVPGGVPCTNPSWNYGEFVRRGGTMICIDPRVTEVARKAKYHLQLRPGEDPTLLAGMIRIVLDEGLNDKDFCKTYIDDLDVLRTAIEDFNPDYVAKRTGLDKDLILEATRAFANGKVGIATTGTGPDMAPHAMLTEHLALVLNTILGRFAMEGDKASYIKMLFPEGPRKAQVIAANPMFGHGAKSRVRGLGQLMFEMPTTALPDEILEPGDGQVRVLFNVGGNPVSAWSDQFKTKRAMDDLDLLVSVDIRMAETCRLSDYVLPAKVCLEREDVTMAGDFLSFYETPYAHYTKAVCEPNGDPIDPWEVYWEIAKRLGSDMPLMGGNTIPMDKKPTILEAMQLSFSGGRLPMEELRDIEGGKLYDDVKFTVGPADPGANAKFQATPPGIVEEIFEIRAEPLTEDGRREEDKDYTHLLISRRLKNVHNSNGREHEAIRKKGGTTNFAYMHPEDVIRLGVASGDIVQIRGKHGQIRGVVEAANDVRPGVISMAHGWGGWYGEEDGDIREFGMSTTRLVATDKEYDPIVGKGRMSAIPVNITRCN